MLRLNYNTISTLGRGLRDVAVQVHDSQEVLVEQLVHPLQGMVKRKMQ